MIVHTIYYTILYCYVVVSQIRSAKIVFAGNWSEPDWIFDEKFKKNQVFFDKNNVCVFDFFCL